MRFRGDAGPEDRGTRRRRMGRGTTRIETAPVKTGPWDELYAAKTPTDLASATINLDVGTNAAAPAPGVAELDNLTAAVLIHFARGPGPPNVL